MKGILYTSNFAKIKNAKGIIISVARFNPKWLPKDKYIWFKNLAPSKDLLKNYKDNKIDWEEYIPIYYEGLNNLFSKYEIHKIKKYLNSGQDVTILCYERSEDNCHRHLLANLFKDLGYYIEEI